MSRPRTPERTAEGGFTLLEIVVAIALLATAFLMLLTLENQSIDLSLHSDRLNTAVLLAQEALAEQELIAAGMPAAIEGRDRLRDLFTDYTVNTTVQDAQLPFGLNLAEKIEEIDANVGWKAGDRTEGFRLLTFSYVPPTQ